MEAETRSAAATKQSSWPVDVSCEPECFAKTIHCIYLDVQRPTSSKELRRLLVEHLSGVLSV
jgi:hypothetical protein